MRQNQYSDIRIVTSNDLRHRSFISFYLNGKRLKIYNGKTLSLTVQPNYAKSIEEKSKLLKKLEFELYKALETNNYPVAIESNIIEVSITYTVQELLRKALDKKLASPLSKYYKRNLISIHNGFIDFLSEQELRGVISNLKRSRIEEFLNKFNSSGTYYMNKRRDLGVLFSTISKDIEQKLMIVKDTDTKKSRAKLHKIYEQKQIKPILDYLKFNHPNLHLCCLITYGCFLRPHEEVRNLKLQDFKNNITQIHLSGSDNKGGRVRVVNIPSYVRDELLNALNGLETIDNIFSRAPIPFNNAYFNTAWTRAWKKMFKLNMIEHHQTLYSFRHTAAVKVYRKTKDLNILQQLLGHSNMIVTLKYLRGLGEANNEELRDVMPELY